VVSVACESAGVGGRLARTPSYPLPECHSFLRVCPDLTCVPRLSSFLRCYLTYREARGSILRAAAGVAVLSRADNFIIARTLGAVNVPEYFHPQRMFALVTMMLPC